MVLSVKNNHIFVMKKYNRKQKPLDISLSTLDIKKHDNKKRHTSDLRLT